MDLARRAHVAFVDCMAVFCDHIEAGFAKTIGGATTIVTGLDHYGFNSVTPTGEATQDDMRVGAIAVAETGFPWCVMLRQGIDDDHLHWVESLDLTADEETVPLMAATSPRPAAWPEELDLVSGSWTLPAHRALLGDAFDLPKKMIDRLVTDSLGADPSVLTVVGMLEGLPVTTAMSVRVGDAVGVFSVGTTGDVRGRGYGAAITWACMEPAFDDGATMAVLQTSPLGHHVYERLGYEVVATHERWIAPTG